MPMQGILGLAFMVACASDEPAPIDPDVPAPVACDDIDGDGVCDEDDVCEGDDATGDADGDGICDDRDACTGDDAQGDIDQDGTCDDLDLCEGDDATGDEDGDGLCGDLDPCLGDNATGDADGDGRCADVDECDDRFNPNAEPICNVLFVSETATGAGDGSSWADAFVHPADALAIAQAGEVIWVAQGRYAPTTEQQDFALDLVEGVAMFGGFDGTELDLADRAGAFEQTVITGDFLGDDDPGDPDGTMTDNVAHLVRSSIDGVLDGFWLEGAYAASDAQSGVGLQHNARGAFTLRNATFSNVRTNGSRGILFFNSRTPGTLLEDVAVIDSTGTVVIGFSGETDIVGFTVRNADQGVANFSSGTIVGAHWSVHTHGRAVSNSNGSVTLSNVALWTDQGATVNSNGGSVTLTDSCANQDLGGSTVHLDGSTPELGFPFVEDGPRLFLAQSIVQSFTSACVDVGGTALHAQPDKRSTASNGTIDANDVDAGAAYLVP